MSYIEDIQGKRVSNPINETNTKYIYSPDGTVDTDNLEIDYQYMYNNNEPVSDIDTQYYDEYRGTVEQLRTKTESYYEALESCLVPVTIPGMSFQPYTFIESEDEDEEPQKIKSECYYFQDHGVAISSGDSKEYVYRTNKVKFISDRHRRLIYDRTIHFMTLKEDEDEGLTLSDIVHKYFTDNGTAILKNSYKQSLTLTTILNNIKSLNIDPVKGVGIDYVDDDEDGVVVSGQDLDTGIPSTFFNLHELGYVHPAMIFLNGHAISWDSILVSVDNIDVFLIINSLGTFLVNMLDDDEEIELEYIHIPFKCCYISSGTITPSRFISNSTLIKPPLFTIAINTGSVIFSDDTLYNNTLRPTANYYDRLLCDDPNIVFTDFYINSSDDSDNSDKLIVDILSKLGININTRFKDFCNNDYRCKLKQFNFIGFECKEDSYKNESGSTITAELNHLKNDDYTIEWHPFNIMNIEFDKLFNNPRKFKVFYNTKVLYDQDNILRIKNLDELSNEYEKYRRDLTANIEIYIKEVYALAKKDIGIYIGSDDLEYEYYTPYQVYQLLSEADSSYEFGDFVDSEYIKGAFVCNTDTTRIIPIDPDAYECYMGDYRGKLIPSTTNSLGVESFAQKYPEDVYDVLKLRFELTYLNNMEEGATPVDEFIYYYSHILNVSDDAESIDGEVSTYNYLNTLAEQIFKYDPHDVYDTIEGLNREAKWYVNPDVIYNSDRDVLDWDEDDSYYNYQYTVSGTLPTFTRTYTPQSEWALRLNLPEMFYWALDEDEYTLSSMNLLDEVFDFTYGFDKSYEDNLRDGTEYIIGYDADKLEGAIKRSIVSITRTGAELMNLKSSQEGFKKWYTVDMQKTLTFLTNNNHKVTINSDYVYITSYCPNSSFATSVATINVPNSNLKFRTQENDTIIWTTTSSNSGTITDVDKSFTIEYNSFEFNYNTGLLTLMYDDEELVTVTVDYIIDSTKLVMSRWNLCGDGTPSNNYVMIFQNGELYSRYSSIDYTTYSFGVDFYSAEINSGDKFEFVFFLNANNNVITKSAETDEDMQVTVPYFYMSRSWDYNTLRTDNNGDDMDKGLYAYTDNTIYDETFETAISSNTSLFDPENVMLLVNEMPETEDGSSYTISDNTKTAYELSYDLYSYQSFPHGLSSSYRYIRHNISIDYKVNGLYRVTRQGGGEYILSFDGKIPEKTNDTSSSGSSSEGGSSSSGGTYSSSVVNGIGTYAFACQNPLSITFYGTTSEWNAITKTNPWISSVNNMSATTTSGTIYKYAVHCVDPDTEETNGVVVIGYNETSDSGDTQEAETINL